MQLGEFLFSTNKNIMLHAFFFLNCLFTLHCYIFAAAYQGMGQRDIHAAQEKDTSGVEFLDEYPKVTKAVWLLH